MPPWVSGGFGDPVHSDALRAEDLACYYAWTGDAERAGLWLERAFELSPLGVEPRPDVLELLQAPELVELLLPRGLGRERPRQHRRQRLLEGMWSRLGIPPPKRIGDPRSSRRARVAAIPGSRTDSIRPARRPRAANRQLDLALGYTRARPRQERPPRWGLHEQAEVRRVKSGN